MAPGRARFPVDFAVVGTSGQSPDYPMQLMIGVFDFPGRPGPDGHVPKMVVSRVRGRPIDATA